jgi:molybdate transport system substrate-binding protein
MSGRIAALLIFLAASLEAAEVRVFAAASLSEALTEIGAAYEKTSGDDLSFNFSASSLLARQIEAGAPADLFLSADEAKMNVLHIQKLIVPPTRVSLLSNTLVVVVPARGDTSIRGPRDLVRCERIALAEPGTVPAGIYAKAWLERVKLWPEVKSKIVPTDNVRSALSAVASANADAAIVYRTDARITDRVRVAYEIPPSETPGIVYSFALVSASEHPAAARRFLKHLASPAALAVFAKHGFLIRER